MRAIALSGGTYHVTTADGRTQSFREHDLCFKTDHGTRGPRPDVPIILPAGMRGDRALVIFSHPEEIARIIEHVM